jgi:DNA-binding MurR/RpiR family transcriptional regulator
LSIHNLIASKGQILTPTERRIAAIVLDDPTRVAFGTVAEIAKQARTSGPSVVRFAAKLGFDGYSQLQAAVRAGVSEQLSTPVQRIRTGNSRAPVRQSIEDAVAAVFQALNPDRLTSLAIPVAKARHVWVLSGETSLAGAHTLVSGLSMLRPGVHLAQEHSIGRDLCGARAGDAAVVIDFPRYRRVPMLAARELADAGVDLVAITDGPLSPLVSLTRNWCSLTIPAVGPFDSSVPMVLAAELIVQRVAQELGSSCGERIDRLEEMWRTTETYHAYTPRAGREGMAGVASESG